MEWVELEGGEILDGKKMAENDSKKVIKEVKRNRISNGKKVLSKVKKVDMRIYDRNF
jgi:hypothetical protein